MNGKVGLIYDRFSIDDDDSFSLDSQKRHNLEYNEQHGIHTPKELVFEDNFTGFTLDRPAFNKVVRLIQERKVDSVTVYKVNRIARESHLAGYFLKEIIIPNRVELHIVEWGRAVQVNRNDLMLYGMQAEFSQFDALGIKEQTDRGRKEKAVLCVSLGQGTMPYGYGKVGYKKQMKVFVIEEEKKLVKYIFFLFVDERIGAAEIATFLTSKGIKSPSQLRDRKWQVTHWTPDAVRKILRDKRYIGIWTNLMFEKNATTGGKRIVRPEEERIVKEVPELAIVSKEQWDNAQRILAEGRNRHTFAVNPEHEYLITGRLKCYCGCSVGGRSVNDNGNKYFYYRCTGKDGRRPAATRSACKFPHVQVRHLDKLVWDEIENLIRNPEYTLEKLRKAQQAQFAQHEETVALVASSEEVVDRFDAKLDELYDDFRVHGRISEKSYNRRRAAIEEERKSALEVYERYRSRLEQKVLTDRQIAQVAQACRTVADVLDRYGVVEFPLKKQVIEAMDITGSFSIEEEHLLVANLLIYNIPFADFTVKDLSSKRFIPRN